MTFDQCKVGDVVALRTGGPRMTIAEVCSGSTIPHVYCEWFVQSADGVWSSLQQAEFSPEQLSKVLNEAAP